MLVMWNEKVCKRSFQSLNGFHLFLQLGEIQRGTAHCMPG